MTARLLEGKVFASTMKDQARDDAIRLREEYGVTPGLAVIIVGEDAASQVYVSNKHKACAETGIHSEVIRLPAAATKAELMAQIDELNRRDDIHGILLQLPLPDALKAAEAEFLYAISPDKDVDGFHPVNVGRLGIGQEHLVPCTPYGCIKMLELAGIELEGKRAVIIGRSNIVGKPMAQLLLARNATVTICHSRSRDLAELTRQADILVVAIGRAKFLTAEMVKPGATVIDVGINRLADRKLVGDVDFESVKEVAGAITPVPGGVGLLTIAVLLGNTVKAARALLKR